jgi:hypothetical protein
MIFCTSRSLPSMFVGSDRSTTDPNVVAACSTLQGDWLLRVSANGAPPRTDLIGFSPTLSDGTIIVDSTAIGITTRSFHRIYSTLSNLQFGDGLHIGTTPFGCCTTWCGCPGRILLSSGI